MDQRDAATQLRPRASSELQSSLSLSLSPASPPPSPTSATPSRRCWRLWLLRLLLLAGALYASALVCWAAGHLAVPVPSGLRAQLGASEQHVRSVAETDVESPAPTAAVSTREAVRAAAKLLAHAQAAETQRDRAVQSPPVAKERRFRCVGWRATADCSPDGPRLPELDKACSKVVPAGESGYCEVEDKDSGERLHVMRKNCRSVREDARFRCIEASDFLKFPGRTADAAAKAHAPDFALPNIAVEATATRPKDGIVMVVYPKLLASAYATVRVLQDVLDCQLPIELWFRPSEMQIAHASLEPLRDLAKQQSENASLGAISFREMDDPRALGFSTKIYALYHSAFERALFLDADNSPARDPSYLFQSKEFLDTGAIFWPDFWHPDHTIFNVHADSLLWQLLDMPFVDMFEQESGQVLIDRRRHAAPLEVALFYAFRRPNHFETFKLVHGDKDLFRLAWLQQNASFHMVQTPPAVAGKLVDDSFCGMTMVQHDTQGEVLFLHRNSHKLTGERRRQELDMRATAMQRAKHKLEAKRPRGRTTPKWTEVEAELAVMEPAPTLEAAEPDGLPDAAIWTHLLSFRSTSRRSDYVIQTYQAMPQFPVDQHCYGQRELGSDPNFEAQEVAKLSFAGLETHLRRFAMQAAELQVQARAQARQALADETLDI